MIFSQKDVAYIQRRYQKNFKKGAKVKSKRQSGHISNLTFVAVLKSILLLMKVNFLVFVCMREPKLKN